MSALPVLRRLPRCFKSILLSRAFLLVSAMSAMVFAASTLFALATSEQMALERATRRVCDLVEAAGASAGQACLASDKTPGQETVLAIDNAEASPVSQFGFELALLAAGVLFAIGLAVPAVLMRPAKAISTGQPSVDAGAGAPLPVPKHHTDDPAGGPISDTDTPLGRFRASPQEQHEPEFQRVLHQNPRLASAVFDHSREGIMITNADNRIVQVNRAFTEITGYAELEVFGRDPRLLASGRHDKEFYQAMWNSLSKTGHWQGEIWGRHKEGRPIPQWLSINVILDEAGNVANYVALVSDLTEHKIAEEKIDFLAHYDQLTGLPNRLLVRARFADAVANARREKSGIAFLFVDLDHFKQVNDGLGQSIGDRMIVEVVDRLSGCVRETDTICRHGADEFIILLTNTRDVDLITRIVQRMLDTIARPAHLDDHVVSIASSVGIALYPDDGKDFETLLGKSSRAMCNVKTSGRNDFRFFSEGMNQDATEKLHLRAMLGEAIRNREFQLHYQPQINIATGRADGVEALIRWPHPTLGNIPPGRFIPLAEECGLILQIGEWVLLEACRQARRWLTAGHEHLSVAVNISGIQFNRGNIVESVRKALDESGLPPSLLELELTESALLQDIEGTRRIIQELQSLGVTLSIDDFGTGYSSLAYLKQIKVNKLKIDRSFVRDIGHDPDDLAIVHAIIQLGRALQLRVVAEGIETAEQLATLRDHGCNEGQGYHFSRPLPFENLMEFLADQRAVEGGSTTVRCHNR